MRRIAVLVALLLLTGGCKRSTPPGNTESFITATNLGKAYLENRESANCVAAFRKALELQPKSTAAMRNLARGHMISVEQEASQAAVDVLTRAVAAEPDSVSTNYLLGFAYTRLGRYEEAVPCLEKAARLDAETATLRYQLGCAYEATRQEDKALEQFAEAVRLDPLHVFARFKLFNYARRAGDEDEWKKHHAEWQRLRVLLGVGEQPDEALLWKCRYTAAETMADPATRRPASPPIDVRFEEAFELFGSEADRAASAVAVLEVDEGGRATFVVADAAGGVALLTLGGSGKLERTAVDVGGALPPGLTCCRVGDFHDDLPAEGTFDPKVHALNDVLLIGPGGAALLKRTGAKTFANITESAGLIGVKGTGACWVDYEHDGDLDLAVASERVQLWQNNGNATFTDVTEQAGLGSVGAATDVMAVDLDQDVATDLVVCGGTEATRVFRNVRGGRFEPPAASTAAWPFASSVLVDDLDNDGRPDAVLQVADALTVRLGRGGADAVLEPRGMKALSAALLDFDNDGGLDILAAGAHMPAHMGESRALMLWKAARPGAWEDVSQRTGLRALKLSAPWDVLAADVDADGDSDLLLISTENRLHVLRNNGGNAHAQLKLRLIGTKTNPTGLGTHVEVRAGDFWVTRTVTALPIEIGLGPRKHVDSIQTVWTNGVVDNQVAVDLADKKTITIDEKNVATGSCPFLYVWDGAKWRFVTDLLGNAPVGLSLTRDVVLPADPDEFVLIGDASSFAPKDGAFVAQITSEFREVLYLDHAKVVSVDHPPDVEVHSTDKLMPPPFPPSELWVLGGRRSAVSAVGDDGIDRTAAVADIDGAFAAAGVPLPPPLRGQTKPLSITMDFVPLGDVQRPVLALTGWLQYGDASTNIAMSQNATLPVIPPTLEVETDGGRWAKIDVMVGMPAGKTKTILVDLSGKLPAGATRLRLTTTFQIRWDCVALFERRADDVLSTHELAASAAELSFRGFCEIKSRAPGHPTTPDHEVVSPTPPWRTAIEGWCTRYGDVRELVAARDDALVVVNAGDALDLRFDAGDLPPVAAGRVRSFFLYSVGWDKDSDYNVVNGMTVEPYPIPLPSLSDGEELNEKDWRIRYNTRWVPLKAFSSVTPTTSGE